MFIVCFLRFCLFSFQRTILERVMGIEPTTSAWKAEVLPVNYTRKIIKLLNGREDRIRTCDPLVPNQVLYQAELLPVINGAPGRSRIHNLLIRSQTLYPIELRAHILKVSFYILSNSKVFVNNFFWCGREDLNLHGVAPTRPST
jgi:hypothetical protein